MSAGRVDSAADEAVYAATMDGFVAEVIGSVDTCAWQAQVRSGPPDRYAGAIVTLDSQGFVRVEYFESDLALSEAWRDAQDSHAVCCGTDDSDA